MHLGLTSLLGSIRNWQKPVAKKNRPASRRRRLFGEHLETRYALAGDVMIADLPPLPDSLVIAPAAELAVVPATNTVPTTNIVPTTNTVPTTNIVPTTETPPTPPPTETPPATNSAPVITMFTYSIQGSWITISGAVRDDQDPTGYTVQLTGLITDTITVSTNDTFTKIFPWNPAHHGTIYGQTQDAAGLLSNIMTVGL